MHQSKLYAQFSRGFSDWLNATGSFMKHQQCKTHSEAVEAVVINLPRTTRNVGELLTTAHAAGKEYAKIDSFECSFSC